VLAVDVRGPGGYGHLFEEPIHHRFGAQETGDIREVADFLKRQPFVDGSRLGIWGCDYGAHTTVHAMLTMPGLFRAGFADSPITDWQAYNAYFAERYLGLPRKRSSEYDDSSPLDSAKRLTGKLLVAASPNNPLIREEHVAALREVIAKVKNPDVPKRLEILTMAAAGYREDPDALAKILERVTQFFAKYL
jgi:dipeptidyl-peptidase-4